MSTIFPSEFLKWLKVFGVQTGGSGGGSLNYLGTWNANTNSPTLTSSIGTANTFYIVSVAGTTNLNGINSWGVGDWAVFNGTVWTKIPNSTLGYLLAANNLSDVDSTTTSLINLGLGNYTDSLVAATSQILTNPLACMLNVNFTNPGLILTLPAFNVLSSPARSFIITNSGNAFTLADYNGSVIDTIQVNETAFVYPHDNLSTAPIFSVIHFLSMAHQDSANVDITGGALDGVAIGSVNPASVVNMTTGAITSTPTAATDIANKSYVDSVAGNANPISNIVYVGLNGNDTTGDGSIAKPYRTLSHALAAISTATDINPFLIELATGSYSETTINLKPNIYINGNRSILNISNVVGLDSSWAGATGEIAFYNFDSLNTAAGLLFDFDAIGALFSVVRFENILFVNASSWSIKGSPTTTICVFSSVFGFSGTAALSIENCYGGLFQSTISSFDVLNSSSTASYSMTLFNNTIEGTLVNRNTGSQAQNMAVVGTNIAGNITVQNTSTGTASITQRACLLSAGAIVDGVNAQYNVDSAITGISFLNGATFAANVTLASISNYVDANYTPTYYTPADKSVYGALVGIDNELGNLITPTINKLNYRIITAAGPQNILSTDSVVYINQTVGAPMSLTLPNIGAGVVDEQIFEIKDAKGDASTNNITINYSGNIDGSSTYVIIANRQSVEVQYIASLDTYWVL